MKKLIYMLLVLASSLFAGNRKQPISPSPLPVQKLDEDNYQMVMPAVGILQERLSKIDQRFTEESYLVPFLAGKTTTPGKVFRSLVTARDIYVKDNLEIFSKAKEIEEFNSSGILMLKELLKDVPGAFELFQKPEQANAADDNDEIVCCCVQ